MNTPTEKEHEEILKQLKKSPVFNMSLASKELFHSNFWAWLFEQSNGPKYINVFFPEFEKLLNEAKEHYPNAAYKVLREHKNMDLRIHIHSENSCSDHTLLKRYVIENKVKSIPNSEQLDGYTKKLNEEIEGKGKGESQKAKKMKALREPLRKLSGSWGLSDDEAPKATCLLTTLVKLEKLDSQNWDQMHLSEVASGIEKVAQNEGDWYHRALVQDYTKMLELIVTLVSIGFSDNVYNFSSTKDCDDLGTFQKSLEELRILDIYRKSRATEFVNYLKGPLREKFGDELAIRQSFNNGHATCCFFFKLGDDPKTQREIGIQIQAAQYRYYVNRGEISKIFSNKGSKQRLDTREHVESANLDIVKALQAKKWFLPKKELEDQSSMQNEWCGYSPSFLYQYIDLPTKIGESLTFEELKTKILQDLKNAKECVSCWR